jgi:hypothetical protein
MMGGGQQMGRGGGGFLSKLFGRGNPTSGAAGGLRGMQAAGRAVSGGGSGGGILQSLSNPAGITGFLNNTQNVLKTAQSFGPMIQQYGPIVKNLPAMWRLYRGFKNASNSSEEKTEEMSSKKVAVLEESSGNEPKAIKSTGNKKITTKKKNNQQPITQKENRPRKGSSIPKLYI